MSFTNAKEDLQYALRLIDVDPTGFSEHSSKRGEATEAARRGAQPDTIQVAGNWASIRIANQYVDHSRHRNQLLREYLD
jgi:hypothetical protein